MPTITLKFKSLPAGAGDVHIGNATTTYSPEITVQHGIAAALSELAHLHASGALTDDEFAAAKRMLSRSAPALGHMSTVCEAV